MKAKFKRQSLGNAEDLSRTWDFVVCVQANGEEHEGLHRPGVSGVVSVVDQSIQRFLVHVRRDGRQET